MKILVKFYIVFIFSCTSILFASAQTDSRSDSLKILNYDITITLRNFSQKTIWCESKITFTPKVNNIVNLRLDLLKFTISSIKINNQTEIYSRNDSVLFITLSSIKNIGDTFVIDIIYYGQPQLDPKWGGFYFSGNYAFNMGVGFEVNPHNFGRCWFPCFDNFTERSTYDLHVTTDSGYKAICGGLLKNVVTNPDNSLTWNWSMNAPVPTYLVSVSVSQYEFLNSTYSGMNNVIPVVIAANASDTQNVKSSMINLPKAIQIFENLFGPYKFEKVGYNVVPFNGGAMEHAGNISYPLFAVQGDLSYETMYAHELSHHWWGDLATCRTEGDMWLNEGWASYCENLFLENLYGKPAYITGVKNNHMDVLRFAHIKDGNFLAVAGLPHLYTYGSHAYKKGSDVIHTLRNYTGDSAFFAACKYHLNKYSFKDVSTDDIKNSFKQFTTANLDSYFNDWIMNKGFCDFKITTLISDANFNTGVNIEQDLRAANGYYNNVPLSITFYDKNWNSVTKNFTMSGYFKQLNFQLGFAPVFSAIDLNENISYARTKTTQTIKSTGFLYLNDALIGVTVNSITDSVLLHVEHHWTAADQYYCKIPGMYLSNYRYWIVDGIWKPGFSASATFYYDGSTPVNKNSGYLDHTLIRLTEDSLRLLWRPDASSNWQFVADSNVIKKAGNNPWDKIGSFIVKNLSKGEYAMGMFDHTLSVNNSLQNSMKNELLVYPNPANDLLNVKVNFAHSTGVLAVFDFAGRKIMDSEFSSNSTNISLDISKLKPAKYFLLFEDKTNRISKFFEVE